jgi:hypothetical protein
MLDAANLCIRLDPHWRPHGWRANPYRSVVPTCGPWYSPGRLPGRGLHGSHGAASKGGNSDSVTTHRSATNAGGSHDGATKAGGSCATASTGEATHAGDSKDNPLILDPLTLSNKQRGGRVLNYLRVFVTAVWTSSLRHLCLLMELPWGALQIHGRRLRRGRWTREEERWGKLCEGVCYCFGGDMTVCYSV